MNGGQAMLLAWWEFGAAAGLLVLAHVLVPLYYRYNCTTTTELLERRLGDPALRRAVSLLFMLGYMFILLPVVLYTGAVFMKSMFGLDMPIIAISASSAATSSGSCCGLAGIMPVGWHKKSRLASVFVPLSQSAAGFYPADCGRLTGTARTRFQSMPSTRASS